MRRHISFCLPHCSSWASIKGYGMLALSAGLAMTALQVVSPVFITTRIRVASFLHDSRAFNEFFLHYYRFLSSPLLWFCSFPVLRSLLCRRLTPTREHGDRLIWK